MEAGSFKDALALLEKSLSMNKQVLGEDDISNCEIFMVMAQVYSKQKNFEAALEVLYKIWERYEACFGKESI